MEVLNLKIYISLCLLISILIILLSFWSYSTRPDFEKTSSYECGFNPFSETRYKFDVKFYLVSLLFIIFDVEIIFMLPFSVAILRQIPEAFYFMLFFIIILFVGFFYEIRKKALDF